MNINNLKIFKNSIIKTRVCVFALVGTMAITMTGCLNSKTNNSSINQDKILDLDEFDEESKSYLNKESSTVYNIVSLSNGEKRKILLSDQPHLYKSLYEKTDTKVYLADESGKRLSKNFDEINQINNHSYVTNAGVWSEVETDKQYDLFVGITLRKDQNNNTLGPSVTLLNKYGIEFFEFYGDIKALFGNIVVIKHHFEGNNRPLGAPDTFLYNYENDKISEELHSYVKIFRCEYEQKEESIHLIGVDLRYDDMHSSNHLYSFYNDNLEIIAISTEEEIKEWYKSNDDYYSFVNAGGNYNAYFKSIYDNIKNTEKISGTRLTKKLTN